MVIRIRKPAAVNKMSVVHSKTFCPFIHFLNKCFFRTCNHFCHYNRSIISGSNNNTLYKCFHSLGFSLFQKNLRASHTFGISTCCCHIRKLYFSTMYCIKNKYQSHYFGYACRTKFFILIVFIQNHSCTAFH